MTYLLDTSIVSELERSNRNPGVDTWWQDDPAKPIALSAVTVGEIERGIAKLGPRNAIRAQRLRVWFDDLRLAFADSILAIDEQVAREWGRMSADRSRPVADTMIAATAKVHGMTLVTRNVRDVVGLGIDVYDPFR